MMSRYMRVSNCYRHLQIHVYMLTCGINIVDGNSMFFLHVAFVREEIEGV